MKKEYKLKYEILVAGIYPFEEDYSTNGYTLKKNFFELDKIEKYVENDIIYISPLIGFCSYNINSKPVYLTFEKEKIVELDINESDSKDKIANSFYDLDLLNEPCELEKYLILNINNSIMFPIIKLYLYDLEGNEITNLIHFVKLNVPSLISSDVELVNEKINRQNYRLSSGFLYENLIELKTNNKFFDRAVSLFYSSFSVNDKEIGFILLITSLETLLNLSTYAKVESCSECSQKKYKISETVSSNVSKILMDNNDTIKEIIKKYYNKRSKYLHGSSVEITDNDQQELQEYVRKILLMYWYISVSKKTNKHKEIINEFHSEKYNKEFQYVSFLTSLKNVSFKEKQNEILQQFFNGIISQLKTQEDIKKEQQ